MITKRDQDIINFLDDFHVATSGQIHRLFFKETAYRYCMKRLQMLSDEGYIKRTRSTIDSCRAYYLDWKPVQVHHDLIRSELYTTLKNRYEVLEWNNEKPIGNIRPDALCYIKHSGIVFPVLIEIHLSNKFDFDKYKVDLKPYFGTNPRIVICTDRQIKAPGFKIVGLDMTGVDTLLK